MNRPHEVGHAGRVWAVAWVSASVLAFEICLLRVLLVAGWYHFAFLVISIALLGFGASGTALCLLRGWVLDRIRWTSFFLLLLTAVSMPLCAGLVQHVPVEARLVPALLGRQVAAWMVYWAILTVPFFFGAAAIGLGLMASGPQIARVYAANLLGSAGGAVLALAGMRVLPPEWLPVACGAIALGGALRLRPGGVLPRWGALIGAAALVLAYIVLDPPRVRPDPYKYAAYVQRLVCQGSAQRVTRSFGPRSVVEAYEGDVFHDVPFLAVGPAPPPMTALTVDGHWAGSVLRIHETREAEALDRTLMAFAYALAPPRPHVLLLGETGGANVWLATRNQARIVDVVQPDRNIVRLLRGPLHDRGGAVLDLPDVHVAVTEPRHFIEHTTDRYDLIHLVTLEGSAAGTGGLAGLAQDYLVTVEGLSSCLGHLSDRGLLFACRGIQTPPRDNLKFLATLAASLRRLGITAPQQHVVVVRDYLAVCTAARLSPWTPQEVARIRALCADRQLTPVWFPGVRPDELNRPDALPVAPDGVGDLYHYAARRIFSASPEAFFDEWPFSVRPSRDDSPYFLDFCKVSALGTLRRSFGDLWLTRVELAFLFAVAAAVAVTVVGAGLTLLPLVSRRRRPSGGRRGVTAGYFAAIGLGYLLLEITFLSRLTLLLGDPVATAGVTISTFLFASGLGSLTVQRCSPGAKRRVRLVFLALLVLGAIDLIVLRRVLMVAGSWPGIARYALAVFMVAPVAYVMGFPMPAALARLHGTADSMIPWAWGINGCASVLASPLATLIGMSWGFTAAGLLALGLYALAWLLFREWG